MEEVTDDLMQMSHMPFQPLSIHNTKHFHSTLTFFLYTNAAPLS